MRTPMFGTRLPRYRTRSGAFDDMVAAQIRRLNGAWPQLVKPVQFAVEDVPPSQPAPWEPEPSFASQCFPASHGIPARIVLYRMPIQSKSRSRMDLELAIRDEVVLRLAELYGRRPDEIDPDWSLQGSVGAKPHRAPLIGSTTERSADRPSVNDGHIRPRPDPLLQRHQRRGTDVGDAGELGVTHRGAGQPDTPCQSLAVGEIGRAHV